MHIDIKTAKVEMEITEEEALNLIARLSSHLSTARTMRARGQRMTTAISQGVPVTLLEKGKSQSYPGLFSIVVDIGA